MTLDSQKPLAGRIALVTGATRGIGEAVALGLAKAGAHVIAVGRTQGALEALDDAILAATGERATLVIATQLLRDIVQRHAETDGHALAAIAGQVLPALDALEQLPSSR